MNNTIKFLVKKVDNGERADIFLSKKINLDSSYPEYIINNKEKLSEWII